MIRLIVMELGRFMTIAPQFPQTLVAWLHYRISFAMRLPPDEKKTLKDRAIFLLPGVRRGLREGCDHVLGLITVYWDKTQV